jgi:hypothetical protein
MITFKSILLLDTKYPDVKTKYYLRFSKRKIYFTEEAAQVAGHFTNSLDPLKDGRSIRHTDTYSLVKLFCDDPDRIKGSKFQIKLESGDSFNISPPLWDGIIMRWLHNRYWLQKNADWIFKAIVTTVIGALIALIADQRGFNEGYQQGLKEGKSQIRDTTQRQ